MDEEKENELDWTAPPYPPTHDFKKVPLLEGVIVSFGEVSGLTDEDGREYVGEYIRVKSKKHGVETVWLTTVIRSRLMSLQAAAGDFVGIKLLELVKSHTSEHTYTNYDVRCIHAQE